MTQMNKRPVAQPRPGVRRPAGGAQPPRRSANAAPPRRSASAAPLRARRGSSGGSILRLAVAGAVVCALALALQCAWPGGFPLAERKESAPVEAVTEIYASGPLRINEIMSGNRRTLTDADGGTPDWIEVANVGTKEVELKGCALSKSSNAASVFTFPELVLAPGECALVLADSRLREDAADMHAPFRISASGDTLMLFNAGGTAIDTVNIPALGSDQSYARMDTAQWQTCSTPTPGLPNTEEGYRALTEPSGDSPVVVTELMSTNRSTYPDENGQYYDYVEIHNRSDAAVNLAGWFLSDDAADPRKWRFPDCTLEPGEYRVVFASKLDRREDPAHLHTNFALSSEGEQLLLSNAQGRVMDRVDFDLLKANVAWSLNGDGSWGSAAAPSPGRANS